MVLALVSSFEGLVWVVALALSAFVIFSVMFRVRTL